MKQAYLCHLEFCHTCVLVCLDRLFVLPGSFCGPFLGQILPCWCCIALHSLQSAFVGGALQKPRQRRPSRSSQMRVGQVKDQRCGNDEEQQCCMKSRGYNDMVVWNLDWWRTVVVRGSRQNLTVSTRRVNSIVVNRQNDAEASLAG